MHSEARTKDALYLLQEMLSKHNDNVPEGDETEKWLDHLYRGKIYDGMTVFLRLGFFSRRGGGGKMLSFY